MRIERLHSTRTLTGPVFCPRCCWKLGRAESPSIGYLSRCGGCKRAVQVIEMDTGGLCVVATDDQRTDDAVFVDVDETPEPPRSSGGYLSSTG